MIFLGHIGPTAAAANAVDRDVDLRWAIALSVGPDLIDKPLQLLFPALVNENTRNVGHSFVGSLVVLALLLSFRRRLRRPFLLWCCYLGHLVLDRMWLSDYPIVFFWPFLGALPPGQFPGEILGIHLFTLYNVIGEFIGAGIVLYLVRRHHLYRKQPLKFFFETGRFAA